jgi:molybdopterin-synthase adenylyltransferase
MIILDDNQLLRYSRHILLPQIAYEGQDVLTRAHALIVGAGGLGSAAALYLAASGVGMLTICDDDTVDLSNLQRQIIHKTNSIGLNKSVSAAKTIHEINPEIKVNTVQDRLDSSSMGALIMAADIVLDCTDNFATRYAINHACKKYQKSLVSGAAIGFDGQIAVFDFTQLDCPCYHCLFPDDGSETDMRCSENGVFSPLVGIIGASQAAEALKVLMGIGAKMNGRLMLFDALNTQWKSIKFHQDPHCPVCARLANT